MLLGEVKGRIRTSGLATLRHLAPVRGGLWRAQRARMAERSALLAQQTTTQALVRERSYRKEFAELASKLTPYISIEKDGVVYFLPTRQKFGVSRFSWSNWKEHRHLERALAILDRLGVELRGQAFVDVGANIGTTMVHAIRRYGFTSGYAFEPEPGNFFLLRVNLAANDLSDAVHSFNVAVSDQIGTGTLALRTEIGSKHHLVAGHARGNGHGNGNGNGTGSGGGDGGVMHVPLVTLDGLVEEDRLDPDSVGLFWLDIEGHELEALRGAQALVSRSIPIVMEFDPRVLDGASFKAFQELLGPYYTGVVDLKTERPAEPEVLPFSALEQVAERHPNIYTDLLVFRSPD